MSRLLITAEREEWVAAVKAGQYRPESLAEDGFIHCSLPEQMVPVADALYRGRQGLVLLVVDPAWVTAEIRFEDCYQSGQKFPHIYGPLPVEAVVQVLDFEPGPDDRFALPATLDRGDWTGQET
ncbi:MAG TPA: DUF952 domain-containing protein [Anaerolineae bacterium]|nr:DUF952 domain-containing protein [Anaerolineae bacterium]